MSYDPSYKSGDWVAICDTCGCKFKASELRKRWDGVMVCSQDWEIRHPLDLIKTPQPIPPLPWTRPEATDQFVTVNYIDTGNNTIPTGHTHGDLDD